MIPRERRAHSARGVNHRGSSSFISTLQGPEPPQIWVKAPLTCGTAKPRAAELSQQGDGAESSQGKLGAQQQRDKLLLAPRNNLARQL